MMQRFMGRNRNYAILLIVLVLCAIFIIIRSFTNSSRMSAEERTVAVAASVNALYYDNSYTFLKEDITQDEIEAVSDDVADLTENDDKDIIEERLASVQRRFDMQNQVNALFEADDEQAVINGATIKEFVVVEDDITLDMIDFLKDDYANELSNLDDGFYATTDALMDEAAQQVALFDSYEDAIADIQADDQLTYDDLAGHLEQMVTDVNEIENPYVQSKLLLMIAAMDEETTESIFQRLVKKAEDANATASELARIREEGQAALALSAERCQDLRDKGEQILASKAATSTLTLRVQKDKPSFDVDTNVASNILGGRNIASARSYQTSGRTSSSSANLPSSSVAVDTPSSSSAETSTDVLSEVDSSSAETISEPAASISSDVMASIPSTSSDTSVDTGVIPSSSDSAGISTSSSSSVASSSSESRDDSSIDDPSSTSASVTDPSQMSSESSTSDSVIENSSSASVSTDQPQSSIEESLPSSSEIPIATPQ
ncbi:hypothetical protein EF384_00205 [Aerococcus agrisoli]|uniref:MapZ extracellular domain-containing protein n=1 Tax=Aerococcus agrisoli TaxID=2487350 RepID=A0A3N4H3P7_9LACT|nr:cell division site-positioning protein MapZ family protein [Aerococcus agrisoli]RPA65460.1 hypothetical protein EF384_00205 [Aerococcus agrisoli]